MECHNVKPLSINLVHLGKVIFIFCFNLNIFKVLAEMISSYIPLCERDYRSKKDYNIFKIN